MKYFTAFFLLFILLTAHKANAQDVVSVYFETNEYKIGDEQFKTINSLASQFNLNELDSVRFIGMADSSGDLQFNFRLSEKRARAVYKYCKPLLPKRIPVSITAIGEKKDIDKKLARRVDIYLYFHNQPVENTVDEITPQEGCFKIDFTLLHFGYYHTITKRRKEYVLLQTLEPETKKNKSLLRYF